MQTIDASKSFVASAEAMRKSVVVPARIEDIDEIKERITSSLIEFAQYFYFLRSGHKYIISQPVARDPYEIVISRALIKVIKGETNRLIIQIPPRYGKTELVMNFCAWAMAQFPDSQFIYVSYSLGLAKNATKTIKRIISLREYQELFGVSIRADSSAQGNFETNLGGRVFAAGSDGEITGRGAGVDRGDGLKKVFGGAIIIDDIHKPSEIHSDSIRSRTKKWYNETLLSRLNDPVNTPIILIGQSLHEDDLPETLKAQGCWETVILPALDAAGNALNPKKHSVEMLRAMEKENRYVFHSQYQQNPIPTGNALFRREWFYCTDRTPEMLFTFITADTAETSKEYNDATVFSFWGLYEIEAGEIGTKQYALHWIDCIEIRVEPSDLEQEFMAFYYGCCRFKVSPTLACIEKKSTGTTLLSILRKIRGVTVFDVQRDRTSGSKSDRFISIQSYISRGLVSIDNYARHKNLVLDHCTKITASDTHRHDDIADTLYDAIKVTLMDKVLINMIVSKKDSEKSDSSALLMQRFNQIDQAKAGRYA